ncbi:hypothetical protein B0H19DRAFT_1247779 [Mycena capillaripes]|nr:hypothetical protein B0H19DRAFT_1247779 [Mycena capillaripes]
MLKAIRSPNFSWDTIVQFIKTLFQIDIVDLFTWLVSSVAAKIAENNLWDSDGNSAHLNVYCPVAGMAVSLVATYASKSNADLEAVDFTKAVFPVVASIFQKRAFELVGIQLDGKGFVKGSFVAKCQANCGKIPKYHLLTKVQEVSVLRFVL